MKLVPKQFWSACSIEAVLGCQGLFSVKLDYKVRNLN